MIFKTYFKGLTASPRRRRATRRRQPVLQPCLESLEIRLMPSVNVIDLGTFGGAGSEATDINASAQIVGASETTQGATRAFLWQDGVMTDLGTLGGNYSKAFGINDLGQIVGMSNLGTDAYAYRAFLLTPEDTDGNGAPDLWFRDADADGSNDLMHDLGTLGGNGAISNAQDVNNLGQVVGYASWTESTGSTTFRAVLWQDGVITNLGTAGGLHSVARAINDAGLVTGWSYFAPGIGHAFLWKDGAMTDLGEWVDANDINGVGQVAGSRFEVASLWTPTTPNTTSGTFTDLGALPSIDPLAFPGASVALGINSSSEIVGYSIDLVPGGGDEYGYGYVEFPRAFVWTEGVMQDLNAQIDPASADWYFLQHATAINDAGQIVGMGLLDTGASEYATRAFLYTPVSLGLPLVSVGDASIIEGNTGTTDAIFTVSLSEAGTQTVTVAYTTVDGTAVAGSDYVATSGTLTFAPGQTSRTIAVPVLGDRDPEAYVETFHVVLSNPANAILADARGYGNISDDEPHISGNSVTVLEGNSGTVTAIVTLRLSNAYDQTVTVDYATADGTAIAGSDYVAMSGSMSFAPGQTTQQVAVIVLGDRIAESVSDPYYGTLDTTEYFRLDLLNPGSNAVALGGGSVAIQDDEPLISFSSPYVSVTEGNAGTTDAVFTVSLSAPYDEDVTVDYSIFDGVYYYSAHDSGLLRQTRSMLQVQFVRGLG
jgi:probable HAF family extracellular repeat protein